MVRSLTARLPEQLAERLRVEHWRVISLDDVVAKVLVAPYARASSDSGPDVPEAFLRSRDSGRTEPNLVHADPCEPFVKLPVCSSSPLRVGVYIDGYNLYYGGRGLVGQSGIAGWKWLHLRKLAQALLDSRSGWDGAVAARVVFCTARISGASNQSGSQDQDVYLRALKAADAVDVIEYGTYVTRVATNRLATRDEKGRPVLVRPGWPIMVQNNAGGALPDVRFMISVARREEKGSDVNVAAHLLLDVLENRVDAAMVVSNDSDLALPIKRVRERVPLGLVNPTKGHPAGSLNGDRAMASAATGGTS